MQNLVSKLPSSPNAFTESKVACYYDNTKLKDVNFEFSEISPRKINILKDLNPSKAADIDNSSGKILKDGADILARPISQLCNLSIKLNFFSRSCKIAKVKPLFKKAPKLTLKTTAPFHYSPSYQKLLKRLFMTKHRVFLVKTKFSTDFWFPKNQFH